MTVASSGLLTEDTTNIDLVDTHPAHDGLDRDLPDWFEAARDDWGEPLSVPEWDDLHSYRAKHGWQGRDLIHDRHAPVRLIEYFVQWPSETNGGVGTTLTGLAHFTARSESHQGFCHGGSMCSIMDDIVGWCAFLTTGRCLPWTGFTVQVNTSLTKPIRVHSYVMVRARITKVERRKVSVTAELIDPADNHCIHATCEGLVILNRGVLPEESGVFDSQTSHATI